MTPDDVRAAAEQLVDFHERFAPLFGKEQAQDHAYDYLKGLMVCPERKSIEPIALLVGHGDVSGLQKFVGAAPLVVLHKFGRRSGGGLLLRGTGSEDLPAEGDVMEPLQAQPHRLRARLIVPLPVHVTAQLRHQPDHLLELRRHLRRRLLAAPPGTPTSTPPARTPPRN